MATELPWSSRCEHKVEVDLSPTSAHAEKRQSPPTESRAPEGLSLPRRAYKRIETPVYASYNTYLKVKFKSLEESLTGVRFPGRAYENENENETNAKAHSSHIVNLGSELLSGTRHAPFLSDRIPICNSVEIGCN